MLQMLTINLQALLIWTNGVCFIGSGVHLFLGRWIPFVVFFCLAAASCGFHYYVDLRLISAPWWNRFDRGMAYAGMFYHFYVWWRVHSMATHFCAVLCFASLWFYFSAFRSWEQGQIGKYVILHSLWHIAAGLGVLFFALV
jgi:hypothetical protein